MKKQTLEKLLLPSFPSLTQPQKRVPNREDYSLALKDTLKYIVYLTQESTERKFTTDPEIKANM